jgi:predicted DNA-binding transcriptional regulator YafY
MATNSAQLLRVVGDDQRLSALVGILNDIQTGVAKLAEAEARLEIEVAGIRRDVATLTETLASHEKRIASLETSRTEIRAGFNLAHLVVSAIGGGALLELVKWILSH